MRKYWTSFPLFAFAGALITLAAVGIAPWWVVGFATIAVGVAGSYVAEDWHRKPEPYRPPNPFTPPSFYCATCGEWFLAADPPGGLREHRAAHREAGKP